MTQLAAAWPLQSSVAGLPKSQHRTVLVVARANVLCIAS